MAFLACPPERSFVRIVSAVAAEAVGRSGHPHEGRLLVAGIALQSLMGALQGIVRLLVVIEAPALPAIGVVTARAIRAEPADMV